MQPRISELLRAEIAFRVQSPTQQRLSVPSAKPAAWRMPITRGESQGPLGGAQLWVHKSQGWESEGRDSPPFSHTSLASPSPGVPSPSRGDPAPCPSPPAHIWLPIPSCLTLERPIRRRHPRGGGTRGRSWLAESEVAYFRRRVVDGFVRWGWRPGSRGRLQSSAKPVAHHGGQPGSSQRPDEALEGAAGRAGIACVPRAGRKICAESWVSANNGPGFACAAALDRKSVV